MKAPGAAPLPSIPLAGPVSPCVARPCSACCHDIEMLLTEADLARLQAARPGEDFWFRAEDGYLQLRSRDGPPAVGSHAAPGAAPRPCWFLGADGSCTVWADRPEGCRLFPAVWDDDQGAAHLDSDWCPYTDGFRLDAPTTKAARGLALRLHGELARRP